MHESLSSFYFDPLLMEKVVKQASLTQVKTCWVTGLLACQYEKWHLLLTYLTYETDHGGSYYYSCYCMVLQYLYLWHNEAPTFYFILRLIQFLLSSIASQ